MELTLTERLNSIVEPVVELNGFVLFQVKYYPLKNNGKLEILIDKEEGGISIQECSIVAKEISLVLDNEDIIPNKYSLEVASPGINWKIDDDKSLKRVMDRDLKIIYSSDGKNLEASGVLTSFDEEKIVLSIAEIDREIFRASVIKIEQEIVF